MLRVSCKRKEMESTNRKAWVGPVMV